MSRVLVTGGGPVSLAAAASLRAGGLDVTLWLHARDRDELARRRATCPLRGVEIAGGDLLDPDPFASLAPARFDHVVHGAAITRFTVDEASAQAVNVEGTRRTLRFAARSPRLRSFVHLSTIHALGLRRGVVDESTPPDPDGDFANAYERSKARAEEAVAASGLPARVARLGTLLARDADGEPVQDNAVLVTLRLLRLGLLPLVPGLDECPVHLLTAREAGEALAALLEAAPGAYHVTTPPRRAPSLGALLRRAHEGLRRDGSVASLRIPLPLLVDQATFDVLVQGADGLASPLVVGALRCVAPFAPQLHAPKTVLTDRAERACPGVLRDDPLDVLDRVVARLAPASRRHPLETAS